MGDRSNIEWTDATWNPVRGCSRVSEGCRHCYAEQVAGRFCGPGQPYEGLATRGRGAGGTPGARWTGEVRLVPERLADPLRWRRPRRVFVNSMSDLFHEKLSNEGIAAVFGVMAACPQHTFQVLTKRPERMGEWFAWVQSEPELAACAIDICTETLADIDCGFDFDTRTVPQTSDTWPLPNVWLGVSVEDQDTADERIPLLLTTPAAVRFASYEPALGPVNFRHLDAERAGHPSLIVVDALTGRQTDMGRPCPDAPAHLDWIIAGSESGHHARLARVDWFRSVRDQAAAAGVPFFFKQWVGPLESGLSPPPTSAAQRLDVALSGGRKIALPFLDGRQHVEWPDV